MTDDPFGFPEHAEFHKKHNPGHDFLLFLRMLADAPTEKFNNVFAAYARNPLGVIIASCAIEGYIHFVGERVDPTAWDEFVKAQNGVRDRIEHIYLKLNEKVTFGSGVMGQVADLFAMRRELVHPRFLEKRVEGKSPPPTVFDRVDKKFSAAKSFEIARTFRVTILRDVQIEDVWEKVLYVEKQKPRRLK